MCSLSYLTGERLSEIVRGADQIRTEKVRNQRKMTQDNGNYFGIKELESSIDSNIEFTGLTQYELPIPPSSPRSELIGLR